MASTADCKKLIVEFIQQTPEYVSSKFFDQYMTDEEKKETMNDALDIKNWKRGRRCKAGGGDHAMHEYHLQKPGGRYNRWGEAVTSAAISADKFAVERQFYCEPFENGLDLLVVETEDGKIYIADYVGD